MDNESFLNIAVLVLILIIVIICIVRCCLSIRNGDLVPQELILIQRKTLRDFFSEKDSTLYDIIDCNGLVEKNICSICLEEIQDLECRLKCGHGFHLECIRDWAYTHQNNNCPQCRILILEVEI